jgi:hypothetical protein
MARQNNVTPFVRSCVALWLAGTKEGQWSVADVIYDLREAHTSLGEVDVSKAVSNELVRLEYIGKLSSYQGSLDDGCGVGRPPRVYCRRVCPTLLPEFQSPTNGSVQRFKTC